MMKAPSGLPQKYGRDCQFQLAVAQKHAGSNVLQ
ncbi:uncharacterized protein METZ01_LOCUS48982 [marine metagenome]|uniref:Uncharacterized protein n=1 Tax=marine metagenome TaxID=408172 RepID=A0A381RYJ8_9ZZZZ